MNGQTSSGPEWEKSVSPRPKSKSTSPVLEGSGKTQTSTGYPSAVSKSTRPGGAVSLGEVPRGYVHGTSTNTRNTSASRIKKGN